MVRNLRIIRKMVYRFKLVSDEVNNFMREIECDSENTFLELRNCILESVDYSKDELDSFFMCNDDWEMEEEITLEDMGNTSSDRDTWLMENTPISELIEDEGQKLVFQFDYMTERGFFMELKEIIPGRNLVEPICTMKRGKAPKQFKEIDDFENRAATVKTVTPDVVDVDPLDLSQFEAANFDDEELREGFDIMDMN